MTIEWMCEEEEGIRRCKNQRLKTATRGIGVTAKHQLGILDESRDDLNLRCSTILLFPQSMWLWTTYPIHLAKGLHNHQIMIFYHDLGSILKFKKEARVEAIHYYSIVNPFVSQRKNQIKLVEQTLCFLCRDVVTSHGIHWLNYNPTLVLTWATLSPGDLQAATVTILCPIGKLIRLSSFEGCLESLERPLVNVPN